MISKIKILCQNLGLWEGHFDHFQGKNTCFLVFLKVGLEQRYRIFFFTRNSLPPLTHSIFKIFVFFFHFWWKKKYKVFFPQILVKCYVYFFFSQEKFKIHSLTQIQNGEKKKNSPVKKKNRIFTHSVDFFQNVVKIKLFREKKKYGTFAPSLQCFFSLWKINFLAWKFSNNSTWRSWPLRENILKAARETPNLCVKISHVSRTWKLQVVYVKKTLNLLLQISNWNRNFYT